MGFKRQFCRVVFVGAAAFFVTAALRAQSVSLPEPTEWTWEVRPNSPSTGLPNVLLVGDSITRGYFPQVTKDLKGVANVYLLATSASVGDPRLPRQIEEFTTAQGVKFAVVHFNNGMHGWGYSEVQYLAAFPAFMEAIERIPSQPRLVWATISPVLTDDTPGPTTKRIEARNSIAESFLRAAGVLFDDQYSLMSKHQDLHDGSVHYKDAGYALMGDQAAECIRTAILKRGM